MRRHKAPEKSGTGVSPVQGFLVSRRNLPHWQEPWSAYYITWRCKQGVSLSPEERRTVLDSLMYLDGRKWDVYAVAVMPTHVHALAQPLRKGEGTGCFDLAEILQSVNSYTAHLINKRRSRKGSLWQDERYDRIVRVDAEFQEKWRYIRDNAVKAGLAAVPEEYPWLYEKGEEHRRDACAT